MMRPYSPITEGLIIMLQSLHRHKGHLSNTKTTAQFAAGICLALICVAVFAAQQKTSSSGLAAGGPGGPGDAR